MKRSPLREEFDSLFTMARVYACSISVTQKELEKAATDLDVLKQVALRFVESMAKEDLLVQFLECGKCSADWIKSLSQAEFLTGCRYFRYHARDGIFVYRSTKDLQALVEQTSAYVAEAEVEAKAGAPSEPSLVTSHHDMFI